MIERDGPVGKAIDDWITERLLAFYKGLIDRGQIERPRSMTVSEEITRCREDQEPLLDPFLSEGASER
jgi:hypothetical protein